MSGPTIDRGALLSFLLTQKEQGKLAKKYQEMTNKEFVQRVLKKADELDEKRSRKPGATADT